MPKSPWGSHIRYHMERARWHLLRAQKHVPQRKFDETDRDNDSKDAVLGTTENLKMEIDAFLGTFESVTDKPNDPTKETVDA